MRNHDNPLAPCVTGPVPLLLGLCLARIARAILDAPGPAASWYRIPGDIVLSGLSVLVILAADRRIARKWPGVRTLFRIYSASAWAGALVPAGVSLYEVDGAGPGFELAVSLFSMMLTLWSAAMLDWLGRATPIAALPCPRALVDRLQVLASIAQMIAARPV